MSAHPRFTPMNFHSDTWALGPLTVLSIILIVVGVVMILIGVSTAQSGCVGSGLMWIGGGVIVGGFGGFVTVQNPYVLISGGAGFVIVLVGAATRAFVTC